MTPAWIAWVIALVLFLGSWHPPACHQDAVDAPGRPEGPTPAPTATPPPSVRPGPSTTLAGIATWYAWRPGQAAAGSRLRAALGSSWRGRVVQVRDTQGRFVVVRLTDWCACPGGRIIDLDRRAFARLADPARGVLKVTVTW